MNNRDDTTAPSTANAQHLMGVERSLARGDHGALNGCGSEPPRKRAKPASGGGCGGGGGSSGPLRRRILEAELVRLRALRDRFTDQLSELYFLQAGGNMMDYAVWRKRPPAPQLVAFLEARVPSPPAPPPAPPAPPPAPPPPPAPLSAADEMVAAAKQEAYVAGRVAELARAGLWAERRLPRVLEPPRPKSHWDYLLEEMAWLAQDFAHERKWKKQAAKKCARAVQKYFQDKAAAAQKAEKAQEMQLKKIAAFAAKEIRTFWTNVEKLVEWKRVRRVERARKEALDEQLSYIVDRTEHYSRQLAAGLGAVGAETPPSDEEFTPRGDDEDDEETIAAAEQDAEREGGADHRAELDALRQDSRRDLTDLLPPGYGDYLPPPDSEEEEDDEETIAEQERLDRAERVDHDRELAQLRDEADLDLEELRRRYSSAPPHRLDLDEEEEEEWSSSSSSSSSSRSASAMPLETLVAGEACDGAGGTEGAVERFASLAASLQPTGTTLSETAVGTPVPSLLRHALREYQHVGLHWLATMYARGLNGILADEMGLGKTVQTIALLAHLALDRQDWGPHLVVAPTSVVLNWEMEFKKWCPAFKILTYYGTIKERKLKRVGWTKANSFHVCITSYKLVVQDHQSFRRKRWKYLVLDEAQNIKNFKSQRWQLLLNFQTERRLLLTGTPLQNSLLELWSLMHFLMPDVFASHSVFREWFGEVGDMAEGGAGYDEALVRRLHAVLRPFLLRRLKADVERQMPRKYEHVLLCRLAKRQRFLYDDFMSRAKTKESLASGNLLSVINVLMQLRKVCNHPDLFEPRPVVSPLQLGALSVRVPALVLLPCVEERAEVSARLGGDLASLEASHAPAFAAHRATHLAPPRRLVEELPPQPSPHPPPPPPHELRLHLRLVPRAPPASSATATPSTIPPRTPLPLPAASPAAAAAGAARPRAGRAALTLTARRRAALRRLAACNDRRCWRLPLYGADLREAVHAPPPAPPRALQAPTLDELLRNMHDTIDRFTVCVGACVAGSAALCVGGGAAAARRRVAGVEAAARGPCAAALSALHWCVTRQRVAFPHPRLLQYDCGKLQTLAALLRRLKAGSHRVLVFTQMTRVLDVLEAFLSMHGHAYLRLDGATRLDARQALVERFNADKRVFAFILSTRSGGVGLNLTGADSVVFYDSDWNPTMDAQAQDRCHRIGQTRDVHVYRLVTAATVEENILRKADQKRRLADLAIDHGHFTTSYLRGASIKELFGDSASGGGGSGASCSGAGASAGAGGELERALAAAEEEADAAAALAARAEASRDLAEFDETLPLEEDQRDAAAAATAAATDPLTALMDQLSPIEKYAMRMVECSEVATEAERAALDDMRRQLHEWERARADLRVPAPPAPAPAPAPDPELTYSQRDARAQVWSGAADLDLMPAWGPPTPPAGDGDVYRESWARALYRPGAAAEALLPAPRSHTRARPSPRARHPPRQPHAPLSLFERGGASHQGRSARARPPLAAAAGPLAPPQSAAPQRLAAQQTEWCAAEDAALRRALRLQRLPPAPPPALAPNWEWVAELVAEPARAYRSPRACRDRHEALQDPERARRRRARHAVPRRRQERDPLQRLEAVRLAGERRRAKPRRRPEDAPPRNLKHAQVLVDLGLDPDAPPTPMEVAERRADRIAREKLKASAPPPAAAAAAPPPPPPPAAAAAAASGAPPPRLVVAASPAPLLYRQQAFPARHLKILHQTPTPHPQSGAPLEAGGALRKLQLQQLALRRAGAAPAPAPAPAPPPSAPAAAPAAPHVLVAHLAPPRPSDPRQ